MIPSRRSWLHAALVSLLLAVCGIGFRLAPAQEPVPSVQAEVGTPRFSRHVQAVFSRLGCNGGTCHGAVKGQNGFKLSLFGADPALDHDQVCPRTRRPPRQPARSRASLLLLKATGQVAHEGGKRMAIGSPEYEILRRWIAAGVPRDQPEQSRVTQLQLSPAEQTVKPGETYRLHVEAKFADGTSDDVTPLCSYESLDAAVATVSRDGLVTARGVGDTALDRSLPRRAGDGTARGAAANPPTPFPM